MTEASVLVNSYYILQEAADLLLRQAERIMNEESLGIHREVKMRHSQFMQHARILHNLNDRLWEDYINAFGDKWQKTDELRMFASVMARITVLTADRCSGDDNKDMHIEEEILRRLQEMPDNGLVSKEILDSLKMK